MPGAVLHASATDDGDRARLNTPLDHRRAPAPDDDDAWQTRTVGKAARIKASRAVEHHIAPAKRADIVLTSTLAEADSTPLRMAVAQWRKAPVVYRLDPSLLDALFSTDLKVMPPRQALTHLPHDFFVVAFEQPVELWDADDELTRVFEGVLVAGMPKIRTTVDGRSLMGAVGANDEQAAFIRGTFYGSIKGTGRPQLTTATIPGPSGEQFDGWTLEMMFDDSIFDTYTGHDQYGRRQPQQPISALRDQGTFAQLDLRAPLSQLLWQVLLYMASPEPDIRELVTPDAVAATPGIRRFARTASTYELGWRVGALLRDGASSSSGAAGSGTSARPHVRRGHWHTYLYGPRGQDRQRRLKWTHPLIVNRGGGPVAGVVFLPDAIDTTSDEMLSDDMRAGDVVSVDRIGGEYRRADETITPEMSGEHVPNPDLRGRGARAHASLQNMFADAVTAHGLAPLSPTVDDPQFDLAWEQQDGIVVVEVKSLSELTETHQLRLGIGQVIEYRWNLAGMRSVPVRAVLFVEHEPSNSQWSQLCRDEQITLAWPATLEAALARLLDGAGAPPPASTA